MTKNADLFQAQLFLDDYWVRDSAHLTRSWHQVLKYPDPVLKADFPWEQWCPVVYGTVLHFQGKFRMWYCGWTKSCQPRCCYAESEDGVTWLKPELGICEFNGSKANNIILDSLYGDDALLDDVAVIADPNDSEWPLKMLLWDGSFITPEFSRGIHAARSKDGINWERLGKVMPGWGDRFNAVPHKLDGKYVIFGRAPGSTTVGTLGTGRTVFRSESDDLLTWSEPELVMKSDLEDPAEMQIYSLAAASYGDLLIGGVERMHMVPDKLDTEVAWSRDGGLNWSRPRSRMPFLTLGEKGHWDDAWVNLPSNVYLKHDNRLWLYYSGRSGAHGSQYPMNNGGIGLAQLRLDGFASLQAREVEGVIITHPMRWPDAELGLNIDCRRDLTSHPKFCSGSVQVEVHDSNDTVIDGFSKEDCLPLCLNSEDLPEAMKTVEWRNQKSMRDLKGQTISLSFYMQDAHLYSFKAI